MINSKTKEYIVNLIDNNSFENEYLSSLRKEAKERGVPVCLKDTAALLAQFVRLIKPATILEIGTAVGYSGSLMLLNSENAYLTTIELSDDAILRAEQTFLKQGQKERVEIKKGNAKDIIDKLDKEYDFIFLDGPKSHYAEYYPVLKALLKKGGILFSDNVLFRGFISGEREEIRNVKTIIKRMREFLDIITKDKDLMTTVLPVGDGVSISIKNV